MTSDHVHLGGWPDVKVCSRVCAVHGRTEFVTNTTENIVFLVGKSDVYGFVRTIIDCVILWFFRL